MSRPTEAGHWYTKTGEAMHEVPYADASKGYRPTTLRDGRKLGLLPSVSAIIRIQQDFRYYSEMQVAMSALTLPEIEGEPADVRMGRILVDARAHAKNAAAVGTAIHASLKQALHRQKYNPEHKVFIVPVLKDLMRLREEVEGDEWKAELSFGSPLGYGGQVDAALYKGGEVVMVVDFKTKEFTPEQVGKKRLTYPDQPTQLAAYARGLSGNQAELINIFISVNSPGTTLVHRWAKEENERYFRAFMGLLTFYQNINDFYTGFLEYPMEEEEAL